MNAAEHNKKLKEEILAEANAKSETAKDDKKPEHDDYVKERIEQNRNQK